MILEYNDVSKLKGLKWYMIETRQEKHIEPTLKRFGKEIRGIFHEHPLEMFIPLRLRDLDTFELATANYIFVRSTNFTCLARLKQVTGIVGLVCKGDTNKPRDAMSMDDSYVQDLIAQGEAEHNKRGLDIVVGSFVRLLAGETRDYCGTVTTLAAGCAVVDVLYKTKHIIVETPIRNLLNLSHVKPNRRVFYYCPEVAELEDPKLIADDLKLTDEAFPVVDESVQATSSVKSRQRTVTAFVRKLVLIDGHRNPLDIASQVLASIKAGNTDPTKNLFIIYSIIKDTLCKEFKKHDPTIKTYKDVKRKYPSTKFNANDIVTIDPSLGIPVHTADTRKAQDGRSREARKNRGKPKPKPEPQPRKRGPKVRRKLAGDKCNTCFHKREEHKLTKQGWGRCRGISDHRIHSWVAKNYSGPCTCVRFKERPIK